MKGFVASAAGGNCRVTGVIESGNMIFQKCPIVQSQNIRNDTFWSLLKQTYFALNSRLHNICSIFLHYNSHTILKK